MVALGQLNTLEVVKRVNFGVYLDGAEFDEILLPSRYVPADTQVGDHIEVFIYLDSEDQPIATTETPNIMVGECALMTVKEVNQYGAFLDWGLSKDLFVPFAEQQKPMQQGKSYIVTAYIDDVNERITASSKLDKFIVDSSPYFKTGQQVEMLICGRTDLGFKAVVENKVMGMIFHSDVIRPLSYGQTVTGYIKNVRDDKKLDLCLQLTHRKALDALSQKILDHIKQQGGRTTLTDKSAPEDIAKQFGVSKSSYKKALGKLYKQRLIMINKTDVTLVK